MIINSIFMEHMKGENYKSISTKSRIIDVSTYTKLQSPFEFKLQKDALVRDYNLQSQNLENELQELRRQFDAKTAMDSRGIASDLLKGFSIGTEEVLKSEIDVEKKILDTFTEDERA
eukprot:583564_1